MKSRWLALVVITAFCFGACAGGGAKPQVEITKPENGAIVGNGNQVQIEVGALGGGQIERIELFIDDTLYETYANPHLSVALKAKFTWVASKAGTYAIKAITHNDKGISSDPFSIVVEVK